MAKKYFKKALSMTLALTMCLSLAIPAFADDTTLSDELLQPGKKDIIETADGNAQYLIDGTYDALNPTDPDADPTENPTHSVDEIIEKDVEGNFVTDKDGNVIVNGDVLDKADEAVNNAGKTENAVNDALTVDKDAEGKPIDPVTVDKAVGDETDKAKEALEAAEKAAADAAKALDARDEKALEAAQNAAAEAAKAAEDAYNNAQKIFDDVIGKLLTDEEQDNIIAEVEKSLADKKVEEPGEDATAEEKAAYKAYQSEFQSALNKANLEAANKAIDAKYNKANEDILTAKAALESAQGALNDAKDAYDNAVEKANMTIDEYVKLFDTVEADTDKAQEVADAYGKVDSAKEKADAAKSAADAKEPDDSDAETTGERIDRDAEIFAQGQGLVDATDEILAAAVKIAAEKTMLIEDCLKQLESATDEQVKNELWEKISNAEKDIYENNYKYGIANIPTARSPYGLITDRLKNAAYGWRPELKNTVGRLVVNLDAAKAAREQVKAEEELKKTLASLSGLSYAEALAVVKGFETIEDCGALADAGDALDTQLKAAQEAAKKVEEANKAYEAAQEAVKQAMEKLNALIDPDLEGFDKGAFNKAKNELEEAQKKLEDAKKDKEDAEEEKKKADDAVIDTITGGGDDFGDTDLEIDDTAIPLSSGPVTRAQFVDYLWRHEGSPAAAAPTFTDVPADHEFAPAIGWAQATGIVSGETFQPDDIIDGYGVRDILNGFARAIGTNAVAVADLTTLPEDLGEAVLNCDEVLAEFFGEEYTSAEGGDIEIAA